MYKYSIEMFKDLVGDGSYEWVTEIRLYQHVKSLSDFDLHDVEGKKKNAKFIEKINNS